MFSILNQTSTLGDSCFYSNVPAEAVTVAIVNYSSFHCLCWFLTKKLNLFNKQCFYWNNVQSQKLQQAFEVQSFCLDTGPQSFCYSFITLSIIRCSKLAHKFAVRVCEVATVVMQTMQLVLSQLKNSLTALN